MTGKEAETMTRPDNWGAWDECCTGPCCNDKDEAMLTQTNDVMWEIVDAALAAAGPRDGRGGSQ